MKNNILLVLAVLILLSGCIEEQSIEELQPEESAPSADVPSDYSQTNDNESIKIATFNIQTFGLSKSSKPEVMEILTKIARNFDVMAVQEFRDSTNATIGFYLDAINSLAGPKYDVVYSPRLGRTTSKEQYAIYFNKEKVQYIAGSGFIFDDADNVFEREPYFARFKAGEFDFVIANIHVKPDDAKAEIRALGSAVEDAKKIADEDDFIVLGDFNADCSYYNEDNKEEDFGAGYNWIVEDSKDTTTKSTNCTYDRIVITDSAMEDYAENYDVFNFYAKYNISQSLAEDVSDHYPVWAEFYTDKDTD